jgi:hypothetical protein
MKIKVNIPQERYNSSKGKDIKQKLANSTETSMI